MRSLSAAQIAKLSLFELEERIPRALERAQLLQKELSLEHKTHPDGREMTDDEYSAWRDRCKEANHHALSEYRKLKEARHRRAQQDPGASPVKLLQAALGILKEVDDLEPDDLLVCHQIETWLSARLPRTPT